MPTISSTLELDTPLTVANGGTGVVTHTSGNILLGNGTSAITSVAILPQSKGGTASNAFYEVGNWTPVVGSSGSNQPSVSYTYRYGRYYRIGNLVYVSCHIKFACSSVGDNYACIKGLPYISSSTNMDLYALSRNDEYYAISQGNPSGAIGANGTTINVNNESGSGANTWVTGSTQYIGYSGCYIKS